MIPCFPTGCRRLSHMVIPLFVGRDRSIQALQQSMERDKQILLVAQKDAVQDSPSSDEIYRIGTISDDSAVAQAARRHREGACRRGAAGASRRIRRRRVVPWSVHHPARVGAGGRA